MYYSRLCAFTLSRQNIRIRPKGLRTRSFVYMLLLVGAGITSCVEHRTQSFITDSMVVTHGGITYLDQKPFTGKTFLLNQQGDTISLLVYDKGKQNGPDLAWYAKGIKKHERYYSRGKKEGVHLGWWPNGRLKFRYEFTEDEYEGSVKEWYEDGTPYRSFTYSKGYEEGPQKMWRPDGRIYANYILKNNRIYGLSGRKNCKSLWKS
jgi:antitoxin component YwqK of YwqJK toxin-antitoxin module